MRLKDKVSKGGGGGGGGGGGRGVFAGPHGDVRLRLSACLLGRSAKWSYDIMLFLNFSRLSLLSLYAEAQG